MDTVPFARLHRRVILGIVAQYRKLPCCQRIEKYGQARSKVVILLAQVLALKNYILSRRIVEDAVPQQVTIYVHRGAYLLVANAALQAQTYLWRLLKLVNGQWLDLCIPEIVA